MSPRGRIKIGFKTFPPTPSQEVPGIMWPCILRGETEPKLLIWKPLPQRCYFAKPKTFHYPVPFQTDRRHWEEFGEIIASSILYWGFILYFTTSSAQCRSFLLFGVFISGNKVHYEEELYHQIMNRLVANCHGIVKVSRKWPRHPSVERVNTCHAKLERLKLSPYISHSLSLKTVQTPSFQAEVMIGADHRSPALCVTFLCSARMALSIAPQVLWSWKISFEKSFLFFLSFYCSGFIVCSF